MNGLLGIVWTRGPSGVYQSQGDGRYVLRPFGDGTYAIDVNGRYQNVITTLDKAKNWCERHRRAGNRERAAGRVEEG